MNRQTHRHADGETDTKMNRQTDRYADGDIDTKMNRQTQRHAKGETATQLDRKTQEMQEVALVLVLALISSHEDKVAVGRC